MAYNKVIAAVEIGTSKVVVLAGEIIGGRSLNIIGMGQSTAKGVKKGEIVDFRAASDCACAAIISAEKNAGVTIEGVYLAQSGNHLEGFFDKGEISVSSHYGLVRKSDIDHVVENAKRKEVSAGRVYIHHIRSGFFLDGRPVDDPYQMKGDRLEVGYWHVHGDERKVADNIHVINGFGLRVEDMIVSGIASGSMVVEEAEKSNGALLLDIGCGTTDYVLYRNGVIQRTGVICVGGDHLTNDLSLGLRVNSNHAENLKREFGSATLELEDPAEKVWLIGDLTIGDRAIPRKAICQILNARVEELFKILKKELGSFVTRQELPGGIVLTGGASRLPNITELASKVLDLPARIGENPTWVREDLRDPEYSCVLGLLYYGLTAERSAEEEKPKAGLFGKMSRLFNIS